MEKKELKSELIIGQAKDEFRKFIAYEISLITGRDDGYITLGCNIRKIERDQLASKNIIVGVRRDANGEVFVEVFADCFSESNIMELEINEIKVISDELEKAYFSILSH